MTNNNVLKYRQTVERIGNGVFAAMRFIVLAGICFYILYPFIQKAMLAVMEKGDLYDSTVGLIPHNFTFENISKVWTNLSYPKAFLKTLFISLITAVCQVASSTLVGYGFARYDFPVKKLLFGMVIFTLLVPASTIIIPMYLNFRFFDFAGGIIYGLAGKSINLIGSTWTFIILGITCMGYKNGLYIYLIRQFYRGVPKELEEAAMLDGAGHIKTFLNVMLPSGRSIMTVVFMFSFVWQWTDIFYSSWFLKSSDVLSTNLSSLVTNIAIKEVSGGTSAIDGYYERLLNSTGCILVILPLLIMYLFAQKTFVESIENSGIVG